MVKLDPDVQPLRLQRMLSRMEKIRHPWAMPGVNDCLHFAQQLC